MGSKPFLEPFAAALPILNAEKRTLRLHPSSQSIDSHCVLNAYTNRALVSSRSAAAGADDLQ